MSNEMSRQERTGFPPTNGKRKITFEFTITIGASGAITAPTGTDAAAVCGFTVVKTAGETGRYTCTAYKTFAKIRAIAGLEGPADAALTSTDGCIMSVRNVGTSSFDVQASQVSLADANPTNGNKIHVIGVLEE